MRITQPHEIDTLQENYIRNGGTVSRFRDILIQAKFECLYNPYISLRDAICKKLNVPQKGGADD